MRRVARLVTFPLKQDAAGVPLWVHHAIAAPSEARPDAQQTGALAWAQNKVTAVATKQYMQLKDAAPDSLRGYAYRGLLWVLDRVDPDVVALRHFCEAKDVQVLLPEGPAHDGPTETHNRLQLLASARSQLHTQRLGIAVSGLFVTVPLAVLPIPSVPLYYNLFRLWSNHRASAGASALRYSLEASHVPRTPLPQCTGANAGGECCRVASAWDGAPPNTRAVVVECRILAEQSMLGSSGSALLPAEAMHRAHAVENRLTTLKGLAGHVRHTLKYANLAPVQQAAQLDRK